MDNLQIRRYLHDLNNALNAVKINAYLLRRLHGEALDAQTMDSLDTALLDAERLVLKFQEQIHAESSDRNNDNKSQ